MTAAGDALVFDERGLIPAVVQEARTGDVLMVAWMSGEALAETLRTRLTHFWSRSRRALWQKGETSGHRQHVEAVYADCDRDTLVVLVHQEGVACHTGSRTCFFTRVDVPPSPAPLDREAAAGATALTAGDRVDAGLLDALERMIQSRKVDPPAGSYVARLLAEGDPRILRKVGEEAAEVIVAALAESPARLVSEIADLWFHTLVLLGAHGLSSRHVFAELARRQAGRGSAAPAAPTTPTPPTLEEA